MRISIALATYNGGQYLQEQLDSIIMQTRLPDEIVIVDDGSTDSTMAILGKFRRESPVTVRISRNQYNLGSTGNFDKATGICNGDIIFFSDQDDVWYPEKIEKMVDVFTKNPEVGYVFSNALVVDQDLRPVGYTMWDSIDFNNKLKKRFINGRQLDVLLNRNVVTGASMAFRACLRRLISPMPSNWIHDAWIAFIITATGHSGRLVNECLIKYRQHSMQSIGAGTFMESQNKSIMDMISDRQCVDSGFYKEEYEKYQDAYDRLLRFGVLSEKNEKLLKSKLFHLRARQQIRDSSRLGIVIVITEVISGRYHCFSFGMKSAAKDVLATIVRKHRVAV